MIEAELSIAVAPREPTGRPPAVLQVLPRLGTGGAERGAVDVAAALVRSGWTAIVASAGGNLQHELDRVGARHVTLPLAGKNPVSILANARRLAALIERERVDIVHARSRAPAWSAYRASRRTGRPFVTTFHGAYDGGSWFKHWYNSVMARGDRVIAISHFIADHIERTYQVSPARVAVIERGIDLTRFHPDAVGAPRIVKLAEAWRVPDGAPVIMLPGRLSRLKGQLVLIDAIARLGRADVQCLFIGEGDAGYRREMEQRIARLRLGGICRIIEHCADMPAAYMLADVVVSASTRPEGFGRTIAEGLAMGRPVIATAHGGAREIVVPGDTGWLVPPGDPAALAGALAEALSLDPLSRILRADTAMAVVRERFDRELMTARTVALYEELLFADRDQAHTS